ncbi:MAG: polyketide cyclase [Alphaproteobacteria bacterium]|nr:polyketide cyclase [Alphaproteobacteria bacterium]
MSDETIEETEDPTQELVFEYALDAPPEQVWRALNVPALRAVWLPDAALDGAEPISQTPGEEICFRLREAPPSYLESAVSFRVRPDGAGGAVLTIRHRLTDPRLAARSAPAVNDNGAILMRAA